MPDDSSLILEAGQAVAPLITPKLMSDDIAIRQKLCGRGMVLKGTPISFCTPPDRVNDAPWLGMTLNGARAAVQVNWGHLRRFTGAPLEGLSPEDATLLIEEKVADWLDVFETDTGLALRLTDVVAAPNTDPYPIGIAFGEHIFRLALSEPAAGVLAKAIPVARAVGPDSFAVALRVQLGTFDISIADLASLRPGDALTWADDPHAIRLLAQDSHSAAAKWTDTGLELTTAFGRIMQGEHLGMASEIDEPQAEAMDDLDVRISVRAGEALMTLGDLRKLGPGSILPMTEPEADHVDLVVNGKRIGTGQLVTVGGTRAVEIKDLFGDG